MRHREGWEVSVSFKVDRALALYGQQLTRLTQSGHTLDSGLEQCERVFALSAQMSKNTDRHLRHVAHPIMRGIAHFLYCQRRILCKVNGTISGWTIADLPTTVRSGASGFEENPEWTVFAALKSMRDAAPRQDVQPSSTEAQPDGNCPFSEMPPVASLCQSAMFLPCTKT